MYQGVQAHEVLKLASHLEDKRGSNDGRCSIGDSNDPRGPRTAERA